METNKLVFEQLVKLTQRYNDFNEETDDKMKELAAVLSDPEGTWTNVSLLIAYILDNIYRLDHLDAMFKILGHKPPARTYKSNVKEYM